jgi:hypothetical protein
MTTIEHPAVIHRRSFALLQHLLRDDHKAYAATLASVIGPAAMAAQLLSMAQLATLLLSGVPAEQRKQLLDEAILALSVVED